MYDVIFVAARHDADIGIQLLFANIRNRVRGAVLVLSQTGACTDLFENLSENSLKGDLSNDTTFKPPPTSFVTGQHLKISDAYCRQDKKTRNIMGLVPGFSYK
jgi:hypothetical protein